MDFPKLKKPDLRLPQIPHKILKQKPVPTDLEVNVMMMGGRRCGKTSVLAAMQECFEAEFNGNSSLVITSADEATLCALEDKKAELDSYFVQKKRTFSPRTEEKIGTREIMTYVFYVGLRGKKDRIRINFVDFPGEWLDNPDEWKDQLADLQRKLERTSVLLIAVDTPHLIECDGQYSQIRNREYRISEKIKSSGFADKGPSLVLFVPLKCERYYKDNRMNEVQLTVQEEYKNLIQYLCGGENSECLAAIAPILTLGGAAFSHFGRDDNGEIALNTVGIPAQQIYYFPDESVKHPEPKFCDQPLLYVLTYTLAMAKEARRQKKNGFLNLGAIKSWFEESVLNWPSAEDYITEYDAIHGKLKTTGDGYRVLNKTSWIKF